MNAAFVLAFGLFCVGSACAQGSNLLQLVERLGATTLVNYIKAVGLETALGNNGPFTLFAPSNPAFGALPTDVKETLRKNPVLLKKVLEFHLMDGRKYASQLFNDLLVSSLVQGLDIRVNVYNKTMTVDGAVVSLTDQNATNGVIHVIDRVMYPLPTGRLPIILAGMSNLSTLLFAVTSGQLIGTLSTDGPFTIFAPNNAAFDELPAGKISDLLSNQTALVDLLKYHVVSGSYYSKGLTPGSKTAVDGKALSVAINSGSTYVNNAKVVVGDIPALNGVIHVIDDVLLPPN